MCGICGFVHDKEISLEFLQRMNRTIAYRGPDDEGYYLHSLHDGLQIGFAQRRLSILDLSAQGHQPMWSQDGQLLITYNGEIYNFQSIRQELIQLGYTFRSGTDTEVILCAFQEWGLACLERFNGMFAFALYDKDNETIYLIRDRLGVKPLYYYVSGNNLVFASELKPIMEYPYFSKQIDHDSLKLYLATQYITGERTIFKNVKKVLPGEIVKWTRKGIEKQSYWSINQKFKHKELYTQGYDNAKIQLTDLLLDATRLRMISDVPLGAFLSNGIDSSLVVALMKQLSPEPVRTVTIGFEEADFDEAARSEKVAEYLGTQHRQVILKNDDAKKLIYEMPQHYDEPFADSSQISTLLVSQVAKQEVTVALTGDAGDEMFCGYTKYDHLQKLERIIGIGKILNAADKICPVDQLVENSKQWKLRKFMYLASTNSLSIAAIMTYWKQYRGLVEGEMDLGRYRIGPKMEGNLAEREMISDICTYLPDDILTKVDRASMAVSLETRSPFLDYRVAEFAIQLPFEYRRHKKILKDILYENVPRELVEGKKRGFEIPVGQWLRADFKGWTKYYFEESYIKKQGIFNYEVLKTMIDGFNSTRSRQFSNAIWTVLCFQMWYERYMYKN